MTAGAPVRVEDVRQVLADGTVLATDVAVVDDGVPRPALLVRTPYSRAAARDAYDLVGLARSGWAVVVQDVRGRHASTGILAPFHQEVDDGGAAVAWAATQPWCDGRVAMTGVSYLGAAQWAAAAAAPSALRAVNPVLAPAAPPEEWLWQGGAFAQALAQFWTLTVLASGPDAALAQRAQALAGQWEEVLRSGVQDDPVRALSPSYDAWRRRAAASRSWLPTRVPAFQVVGWYDVFCESGLTAHATQAEAGVPVVTVVGPWAHNERLTNLYGEIDLGATGNGELAGVREQGWAWLRDRMDGVPAGEPEVRYYVMGAQEWRSARSWPPPGSREVHAFLVDEALSPEPPTTSGQRGWRHDPDDPVPARGGRQLGPSLPLPGPCDQRSVEQRPDVLVFSSPVLAQPLEVVGVVRAALCVSTSAATMDLALTVSDVHPDGRSFDVVAGLTRISCPSGEPVELEVGSTAHAFQPGHRVRLTLAGAAFPRCDVSPTTPADHVLRWGPAAPSALLLPVTSGALPRE